jgi:hypothetical protein
MTMNGSPVPVPKESLFKTGQAQAKDKTYPVIKTKAALAIEKTLAKHKAKAQAAPAGVPGVPLIKAKAAPKSILDIPNPEKGAGTVIPVAIPYDLAQSILNKPSTGGGWQALMGELQKVLVAAPADPTVPVAIGSILTGPFTHVLNLTPVLLNKLVDKATLYGPGGGYQGVMKSIVCLAVKQHPGQILNEKGGQ